VPERELEVLGAGGRVVVVVDPERLLEARGVGSLETAMTAEFRWAM
jgi:hypothetical protein